MYNQQFLRQIREHEARLILPFLPQNSLLLEIGAGSGWQAKVFSEAGVKVVATELKDSIYLSNKDFPFVLYDGKGLPFKDHAFDIVFTSNVVEHIQGIEINTMSKA